MRGGHPRLFRILTVCTGNQCRSPAIERMLGHLLIGDGSSRFEIESAGTRGPARCGVHPHTRAGLERRGISAHAHSSHVLTVEHLAQASLVITAERSHRAAVATLAPWAASSTFTLLEFARLSAAAVRLGVMSPAELVAAAAALRARIPPQAPQLDDLADPVTGTIDDHEVMLGTAQHAVAAIVDALAVSAEPPIALTPRGRRALTWQQGASPHGT